ncbi:MAG: ABC transporter permease [Chitinophagaceae bacterium]|jgi:phospholipid/cholesterol/gamma-HCH transport system permease protein|nr:ABC transporter permease [Chitinophagaceae bacterium]
MQECIGVGIEALPVVIVVAIFLGMVMTLQMLYMMDMPIAPKWIVGKVLRDLLFLELCPTGIGIILGCIIGSKFSTDIAYHKMNEQIDALEVMGVNTASYFIHTKIMACIICIPLLIILSIAFTLFGGWAIADTLKEFTTKDFLTGITHKFNAYIIMVAMVKAVIFAFIISSVSCFFGYTSKNTTLEMTRASIKAVTINCVALLIADYIISSIMLQL